MLNCDCLTVFFTDVTFSSFLVYRCSTGGCVIAQTSALETQFIEVTHYIDDSAPPSSPATFLSSRAPLQNGLWEISSCIAPSLTLSELFNEGRREHRRTERRRECRCEPTAVYDGRSTRWS